MKVHHVGLYVHDLMESRFFYEKYFGFQFYSSFTINDEDIIIMILDTIRIELIYTKTISSEQGTIHFAWEIANISSWIAALADKGLVPFEGPICLENGWEIVFYQGPNKEIIELIEV